MSAKKDGERAAALVRVLEKLSGEHDASLGEVMAEVFGWSPERVFLAIDAALEAGLIARGKRKEISAIASGPAVPS